MSHAAAFAGILRGVLRREDVHVAIDRLAVELHDLDARRGRLFVLGVGGGAANAAHAASDLRKLCGIEAYAPADGITELTARANDEGWRTIFSGWLRTSHLSVGDALLVFSVGGGTPDVSACIVDAVMLARDAVGARVLGVVGRPDGVVARLGHSVVVADPADELGSWLTPVTETLQVAVIHALVSDPRLKVGETKW